MSVLRVEQWSAAQAQAPALDSLCTVTKPGPGKPSLLDTLKAAAQEAAMQAAQQAANLKGGNPLMSPDLCPRPLQTAQDPHGTIKGPRLSAPLRSAGKAGQPKTSLPALLLKRPAPRAPRTASAAPSDSPHSPQAATAASAAATRYVHRARNELAKLEIDIPWEAVLESWKLHRTQWRRTLRQAESAADITSAIHELRDALSIPGSPFRHYGGSWDQLLARCSCAEPSLEDLTQLLNELKANARAWIKVRERTEPDGGEEQQDMQEQEAAKQSQQQDLSSPKLQGLALRGLEALWQAAQHGQVGLAQCPLEAILDYREDAIRTLRSLLQREIDLQSTNTVLKGAAVGSIFASFQEHGLDCTPRQLGVTSSGETASESIIIS